MSDRPDGVDFINNGTLRLYIDGREYPLRRPKTGEFKELRLQLRDIDDATMARLETYEEGEEAPEGEEETASQILMRERQRNRRLQDEREEAYQEWVRSVWLKLGSQPLPDDVDEWPVFLYTVTFAGQLVEHWQSVPLGLGGR